MTRDAPVLCLKFCKFDYRFLRLDWNFLRGKESVILLQPKWFAHVANYNQNVKTDRMSFLKILSGIGREKIKLKVWLDHDRGLQKKPTGGGFYLQVLHKSLHSKFKIYACRSFKK